MTFIKEAVELLQLTIDNAYTTIKLAQNGIEALQRECEHEYQDAGGPYLKCQFCNKLIKP